MILHVHRKGHYSEVVYLGCLTQTEMNRWMVHRGRSMNEPHDFIGEVEDVYSGMRLLKGE